MFGISMWETAMIVLVALVVLGPKQLIEVARVAGKLYRDVQKMLWDVRRSVDLDSVLNAPPPSPPPRPLSASPPQPQTEVSQSTPEEAPRTGPDFYAELLESSKRRAQQESDTPAPAETEGGPAPINADARPNVDQESAKGK